jgi:galactonate dehydratase
LKITDIRLFQFHIYKKELLFVAVDTDEGITGAGEATLREKTEAVAECIKRMKSQWIGNSPFDIERMFHRFFTEDRWRGGVIQNTAISAIEMACWDIVGQKAGLPLYEMLGGKMREEIQLYGNAWSMSKDHPTVEANALAMVEKGFRALKWNPLTEPHTPDNPKEMLYQAVERVASVRNAVGPDIQLFIDCHGMLDYDASLWLIRALEPYDPGFIEEPMHPDNKDGFKKLTLRSNIPLAGGERIFTRWGYKELLKEGVLSIVQLDLTHAGGILEGKKIAAMAEAEYVKVAPHNSSGPLATAANVQLDATLPNFFMQECMSWVPDANNHLFKEGLVFDKGKIVLTEKPGLGMLPDWEVWEREGVKNGV